MKNNKIVQHVENYGFEVQELENYHGKGYRCVNHVSNSQFILISLNEDLSIPDQAILLTSADGSQSIQIVYLIYIKDNIDEVMQLVQANEHQDKIFLIYDEEDEIEFFLKDLWNIIIEINR
ncbi:MAG: hypothetical protein JJT76_12200 [Clostridiaceae bacterium]|nr:hypothetical protein [Clostridiaceae bacterium]